MPRPALLPRVAAAFAILLMTPVAAQDYPTKPIRMIIPFPPGGGSDVTGRVVATALSERLGRQVIVDNRAGAGGVIGTELAANASKDGYTLLMVSLAHVLNPWLHDLKGRYHPIKSFAPIAPIAASPVVLVVNPAVPVKSVADLVALAEEAARQAAVRVCGGGQRDASRRRTVQVHRQDRHAARAVSKAPGPRPRCDRRPHESSLRRFARDCAAGALGQAARAGRRFAQAQSCPADVPSIAEAGVPGYETVNWFGIVAPAGTPAAIVERLHREVTAVQNLPEVQKQFVADGATLVRMSPARFGDYMAADMNKWERVVKEGGIKAQ